MALLDLLNNVVDAFENKSYSAVIFLDFAKAFDTVNHDILIDKLEFYGVRGTALSWFKSYLINRKQVVSINGVLSSELTVNNGVPQGSVLGPILFLLYINDISNSSKILDFFLFADDTSLLYSNKNMDELEYTLNRELTQIQEWLLCNKLSLNITKSNFIIFHSPKFKIPFSPTIKIDNEPIIEKDHTKYLGVIIDKHLTWKQQIATIKTKLAKTLGIIFKAKYYASPLVLKQIYYSFFYPYLNYAILLWGNAYSTLLNPIRILQKRLLVPYQVSPGISILHHFFISKEF